MTKEELIALATRVKEEKASKDWEDLRWRYRKVEKE